MIYLHLWKGKEKKKEKRTEKGKKKKSFTLRMTLEGKGVL